MDNDPEELIEDLQRENAYLCRRLNIEEDTRDRNAELYEEMKADLALYKKRVADIATEREQLEAALDAARAALRQVEWVVNEDVWRCPWCGGYREDTYDTACEWWQSCHTRGHAPDCPRQLALAGTEGGRP